MKIQIELITDFGIFKSQLSEIEDDKLEEFKQLSKNYYKTGLELDLEDGSFAIFTPDIIKKSIFKIKQNV